MGQRTLTIQTCTQCGGTGVTFHITKNTTSSRHLGPLTSEADARSEGHAPPAPKNNGTDRGGNEKKERPLAGGDYVHWGQGRAKEPTRGPRAR